ncbi:MAG: hypothetical protein J0H94_17545, partial [Rhizobiales bacterium]|nr:hypothetical protein [Hyphomicrobiales bacterium]
RYLAVPVDDRINVERVGQVDPKPLAGVEDKALTAGTGKAENGGRAAIDIECPGCGGKCERHRPLRKGSARKVNGGKRRRPCGQKAAS